jgi:HK97 family phage portal protein
MGLIKHIIKSLSEYYSPAEGRKNNITFKSDDPPGVWKPLLGYDLLDRLGTQDYYKSFAYACINKKAYNLANAEIYLYRQFKSKRTEIPEHPFLKLLRSRNSYGQSFKEMLFLASVNCDLNGSAYLLVSKVEFLGRRLPVEFVPLPARFVTPVLDSQNLRVEHFLYESGEKSIKINPADIIRFKLPHPESNIYSIAPVSAFNFTLDIEYLQSRYQRRFFDNDGTPGFVISLPKELRDETFERYKKQYKENYSGVDNARNPLILDSGASVTEISRTQKEMDFTNSRKQILEEIMLILDVSKQVMNIFEDSNYSNSRNALMAWIKNSIEPYANMVFNEQLTAFAHDNYDEKLITKMEYDITDAELQLKEIDLFAQHGLATKNELRRVRNRDDYDDKRANDLFYK